MKSLALGGVALAMSLSPMPALADGAPPTESSRIDAAAGAAAAAAASAAKPAEAAPPPSQALSYDYRAAAPDQTVTYHGRWTGTWTGHYEGRPETVYSGTFEDEQDGQPVRRERLAPRANPYPGGYAMPANGAPVYGYGWAMPMMMMPMMVMYQPMPVSTTTVTTEEEIYSSAPVRKRPARRSWKPRPKPRCTCLQAATRRMGQRPGHLGE